MSVKYELLKTDGKARCGRIICDRGVINTPVFMPVGTYGAVKSVSFDELERAGAEIILGNTFHLMLRPGVDVIKKHGTLHDFINWHKPILTDSGGFQVFSLSKMRKLTEEGVIFNSPIDGIQICLTPERSIEIQHALGSDIIMVFDECTPYPATYEKAKESMELSMRWARRSKKVRSLFGIIQGGMYKDLRLRSLEILTDIEFDGYYLFKKEMFGVLDYLASKLPSDKPRYLMGVGTPKFDFRSDCVMRPK